LDSRATDAGAGEVWNGRIEATGDPCAVRLLRLPGDPQVREHVRRAGRVLGEIDHPHLVPVIDVIGTRDGVAVLTEPVPGAASFARILERRERLDPGEVVTIGLPIAQALAALHESGHSHGRLTAEDILVEPIGRPVLTGLGVAGLLGSAGDPADDVKDLARILLSAMRQAVGPTAAAVAVAVSPALVEDPYARPDAAELAEALGASATPLPVRLAHDTVDRLPLARPSRRSRRARSVRRTRVLPVLTLLAALAVAAVIGVATSGGSHKAKTTPGAETTANLSGGATASRPGGSVGPSAQAGPGSRGPSAGSGRPAAPSATPASPRPGDWRGTLAVLDTARARAFERGELTALAAVDAPGSPALAGDTALMRDMLSRGAHASGLRQDVLALEVRQVTPARVVLRTTDRLRSYSFLDRNGRVLTTAPEKPAERHEVTLTKTAAGWRISTVSSAV
jgi:hypothetical protein